MPAPADGAAGQAAQQKVSMVLSEVFVDIMPRCTLFRPPASDREGVSGDGEGHALIGREGGAAEGADAVAAFEAFEATRATMDAAVAQMEAAGGGAGGSARR